MRTKAIIYLLILICPNFHAISQNQYANGWKAGVAKINITPRESMWLAGFAIRTEPSTGMIHDLWAKALALEDETGEKAVLVTMDLLGIPKVMSDEIRDQLKNELGLERAQIILNCSHTHSGPVLDQSLVDIYPLEEEDLQKIRHYSAELVDSIVEMVRVAFNALQPARLFAGNGVSRIQVNRRNNTESQLELQAQLQGPHDFAVPVLKVCKPEGDLIAIAFGYACHPTVLDTTLWSGDYPGFAQSDLEKEYPGAMALFFQGAGGDQNPMPRKTIPLARQHGRTLVAAVDRVLEEEMVELVPTLVTNYKEVKLGLNDPPTEAELVEFRDSQAVDYQIKWAERILDKIRKGEVFPKTYPFPLQVWKIGDQPIFALGGELVVGYSIQLKRIFGHHIFVLGYSNDVVSYIPTATILHEGGYEGCIAQQVYGLAGTWTYDIESVIMQNLIMMARDIGVEIPGNKLIKLEEKK